MAICEQKYFSEYIFGLVSPAIWIFAKSSKMAELQRLADE